MHDLYWTIKRDIRFKGKIDKSYLPSLKFKRCCHVAYFFFFVISWASYLWFNLTTGQEFKSQNIYLQPWTCHELDLWSPEFCFNSIQYVHCLICARCCPGHQEYKDKSDMVFSLKDFTESLFKSLISFEGQFSHL